MVAAARRSGGSRGSAAKRRTQVGTSAREIRDWARSNGHKVPDRGRIPADVREAFEAAHLDQLGIRMNAAGVASAG